MNTKAEQPPRAVPLLPQNSRDQSIVNKALLTAVGKTYAGSIADTLDNERPKHGSTPSQTPNSPFSPL